MILIMFRTRDFVLVFTTIVFLLVAIGATVWQSLPGSIKSSSDIVPVAVTQTEYPAVIADKEEVTKGQ